MSNEFCISLFVSGNLIKMFKCSELVKLICCKIFGEIFIMKVFDLLDMNRNRVIMYYRKDIRISIGNSEVYMTRSWYVYFRDSCDVIVGLFRS